MWEVLGLSAETPITYSGHRCRGAGRTPIAVERTMLEYARGAGSARG